MNTAQQRRYRRPPATHQIAAIEGLRPLITMGTDGRLHITEEWTQLFAAPAVSESVNALLTVALGGGGITGLHTMLCRQVCAELPAALARIESDRNGGYRELGNRLGPDVFTDTIQFLRRLIEAARNYPQGRLVVQDARS